MMIVMFYSSSSGFTELLSAIRSQKGHFDQSVSPSLSQVSIVMTVITLHNLKYYIQDSNPQPHPHDSRALTTRLLFHI